ncbi:MAG TPA: hypothetical protein VKV18_12185 [Chthonomonas sp.]|uniref:hypothetical protein n=1 Tax=Chthonomonas sp. TaxID=2282153 RepID=UPI002B4B2035|nr:hypothetical protein [Chthonomonas sp.]HLI49432.1 hypothetical protein [Chthonomonas sp.]
MADAGDPENRWLCPNAEFHDIALLEYFTVWCLIKMGNPALALAFGGLQGPLSQKKTALGRLPCCGLGSGTVLVHR